MKPLLLSMLRPRLTGHVFGSALFLWPRVTSTNDVLKEMAAEGAEEGTVVVAEEQTAGRGRLGRAWLAPPGACLLCSLLFRPRLLPTHAHRLTMLCALAAAEAVEGVSGVRPALKWPNDLVIGAAGRWRKLAGLLTESGVTGDRLDFVIVGIGINVNVTAEDLAGLAPDATSLMAETGQEADRAALLVTLLDRVEERYARLKAGENPHAEWAARLITLGQRVEATTGTERLVGLAEGVDEDGALLLRTPDGGLHHLRAADVTLAPPVP